MDHPSPDDENAAVARQAMRARIHAAGESIVQVRGMGVCLAVLASVAGLFLLGPTHMFPDPLSLEIAVAGVILAVPTILLCVAIGLPILAAVAYGHRVRLRRDLRRLPPDEIATILGEPHNWPDRETRRIVQSLARDLRVRGTEMAPASTPAARGDEVAPG